MGFFNKLPRAVVIIGSLLITAGVCAGGAYAYSAHSKKIMEAEVNIDTIYQGITIDNVDVSGKTRVEAQEYLAQLLTEKTGNEAITITHEGKNWQIPFSSIDASYDFENAVNIAWETGRIGELKQMYDVVMDLKRNGLNIDAKYSFDQQKLTEQLEQVASELNKEAQNSTLTRSGGAFVIGDSATGYKLDVKKTAEAASKIVETKKSGNIKPVIEIVEPAIKREDNEKVTDLIGTYYTAYSANAKSRNENLRLGSENISGTLLAPGDVFSMNEGLGPQTYEYGYKDAGVYVNGKVEQGVGGGVCQITSTLYNAVILAELEIVERYPHSMTVGYVPLGRDSAVAGTYKDLKFKNNTDAPIYIEAYATDGKQVCNIYGKEMHKPGRKLEYETVYERTIPKPAEKVKQDANMPEGERVITSRGKEGCAVTVFKKVFQDGELLSREKFSSSSYISTADEVTVGTKKAEEIPQEEAEGATEEAPPLQEDAVEEQI